VALTVVIDGSVALATALPLPCSADADRRVDGWRTERATMAAPILWAYEVMTGLRRAAWEKMIDDARLEQVLGLVEAMELELVYPSAALNRVALDWAARLGQSKAYDGHYLAVAEHLGAQFWTADRRLANALAERGVGWTHWIGEP
jgi:predicted nucleic acid-binding protein